ncbi:hypothetical protein L3X38_037481 [Prunus dulcis]|uniref:Uncharacterized protein n=1 Tax=Prunus dulcis TaxID=3755 RepID=A0AAD4V3H1_PRUDU|nr:hypothetical protein L3X38_037481 [Prunus dulcis]
MVSYRAYLVLKSCIWKIVFANGNNQQQKAKIRGWQALFRLPSTSNGCYAFENKLDIVKSDATEFMDIQIVRLLFKKCEDLILGEIKNLRIPCKWSKLDSTNSLPSHPINPTRGMPRLKAICHDQLPQSSFINLRSL